MCVLCARPCVCHVCVGGVHMYSKEPSIHKDTLFSCGVLFYFQLKRTPRPFPKLEIKRKVEEIDDFTFNDFVLSDYQPHPKIDMDMSV